MKKQTILLLLITQISMIKGFNQCISSGSRNGSQFVNTIVSGETFWTNPSNVVTSNTVSAIADTTVPSGNMITTGDLRVGNFGFTLPTNALICGISVKVERRQQGAVSGNSSVKDNTIRLISISGQSTANRALPWAWTDFYANTVYGGPGDTWGETWTASQINDPNFGVIVSANLESTSGASVLAANIDHISVTVFYTVPLPVELNVFAASLNDAGKVQLDWSTLSETNADHFSIEHATDGFSWKEIGTVNASGNSNELNNYSFVDPNPVNGTNYYKLVLTDADGKRHEFEPTSIDVVNPEKLNVQYFDSTHEFQIINQTCSPVSILVLDYSGREVQTTRASGSETTVYLSTSELPSGVYMVLIESTTEKLVRKFYIP